MRYLSCFVVVSLGTTLSMGAADSAGSPPSAAAAYQLKHRSAFSQVDAERAPFWPIGWVKREAGSTPQIAAVPKVSFNEKNFVVTSILLGNPSLAVINGRSYTEGEFLRTPRGGETVRIRVQRILDGGVQLQAEKQLFLAKLQRQELDSKRREEQLLLDDR